MPLTTLVTSLFIAFPPPSVQEQDTIRDLLQDAAAVTLSSVRYTVEQRAVGEGPAIVPKVTATIIQQRADVPNAGHGGGKYLATGEIDRGDGRKSPFAWSYDGQTLRVLDPEQRIVAIIDSPDESDAGRMLGFETGLLPFSQFMNSQWWKELIPQADAFALQPETDVHGVKCDVILVAQTITAPDGAKLASKSRWSFGKDDHLPRAFETSAMRREISRLEIDPPLTDSDFTFKVPEGFTEKRVLARAADMAGLLAVGSQAPAFTLKTPDGKEISLEDDLKGRIVVLDFWATWCGPCKRGMPGIQALREKFEEKDVAIFGVSVKEQPNADPAGYMKSKNYTYGLLLNGEHITDLYKAALIPTIYVLDRTGKVLHGEKGFREGADAEIAAIIEKALKAQ